MRRGRWPVRRATRAEPRIWLGSDVDVSQMTGSDVDDVARLINQLHPDQPGVIRPERVRSIGTELVERWKWWLIAEGVPLGFASMGPDAVGFYEQCGFPTLHRTLARVGSQMRPIQALNSAGGDADSVRELSVTATGRCSANDRSAAAATRAMIRPPSR